MDELESYLLQQKKELDILIKQAEEFLQNAPNGSLRIAHSKKTEQYYWRKDPKDAIGSYIKKNEEKLIHDLAQKSYAQKILPIVKEKRNRLEEILRQYNDEDIKKIYSNLSIGRQQLIRPYVLPDNMFTDYWEQEKGLEKQRHAGNCAESIESDINIVTEKGEVVRSKSEKILADKLYLMNIPYIYEMPLFLHGYGYIKPDFTVFSIVGWMYSYLKHETIKSIINLYREILKTVIQKSIASQ